MPQPESSNTRHHFPQEPTTVTECGSSTERMRSSPDWAITGEQRWSRRSAEPSGPIGIGEPHAFCRNPVRIWHTDRLRSVDTADFESTPCRRCNTPSFPHGSKLGFTGLKYVLLHYHILIILESITQPIRPILLWLFRHKSVPQYPVHKKLSAGMSARI